MVARDVGQVCERGADLHRSGLRILPREGRQDRHTSKFATDPLDKSTHLPLCSYSLLCCILLLCYALLCADVVVNSTMIGFWSCVRRSWTSSTEQTPRPRSRTGASCLKRTANACKPCWRSAGAGRSWLVAKLMSRTSTCSPLFSQVRPPVVQYVAMF